MKYFALVLTLLIMASARADLKIVDPSDIRTLEIQNVDQNTVSVRDTQSKVKFKFKKSEFGANYDFRPGSEFALSRDQIKKMNQK